MKSMKRNDLRQLQNSAHSPIISVTDKSIMLASLACIKGGTHIRSIGHCIAVLEKSIKGISPYDSPVQNLLIIP